MSDNAEPVSALDENTLPPPSSIADYSMDLLRENLNLQNETDRLKNLVKEYRKSNDFLKKRVERLEAYGNRMREIQEFLLGRLC